MKQRTGVSAALCAFLLAVGYAEAAAQQVPIVPPAPAEFQNRHNNIVVRLSETGTPSINDQPVPWDRLETELKAIFGQRPEKVLFIETAPTNRIEDVRRVLAAARKQGIRLYALFVAPPPNG